MGGFCRRSCIGHGFRLAAEDTPVALVFLGESIEIFQNLGRAFFAPLQQNQDQRLDKPDGTSIPREI
jgi:hypothetical protein